MARRNGGDKRSSWLTFQRRLFLVRQLFRGPARAADLIAAARAEFDAEIYPPDAHAALRHDFAALRTEFDCSIEYTAADGYQLVDPGRLATLDLPEAELEALAFLCATFADGDMPNALAIDALLERIVSLLPAERRRQLPSQAARPRIDRPAVLVAPAAEILAPLKRAVGRQQVAFAYCSSYAAGAALNHTVAPYDLLYRDGHIYLDAYCYTCDDQVIERPIVYRVDRIVPGSLRALPTTLPPGRLLQRSYLVRYWLSPLIARRRDIALWFAESQVEFDGDGAALVCGRTNDLWQARQILLRYREHCRVLEPPELVEMMRESIERMYAHYRGPTSQEHIHD